MYAFQFQTTKSILSEVGATAKIGALAKDLGATKVAFISDRGVMRAGLADEALASLEAAGIGVWIFDEVVADPPEAMILKAVATARAEGAD
ncbi:MAG: iron-containing alcohol dehydrogenase, partial [Pseudomonadota bacterium]